MTKQCNTHVPQSVQMPGRNQHARHFSTPGNKAFPWAFNMVLFFLLTFGAPYMGKAQLPCFDVTNECAGYDPAVWASFKCIQGPVNISDLIGSQLLPQQDAATTPQNIVIKGKLRANISTASDGYTFAEGSRIIFNDAESGIEVLSNCKLTLDHCDVSGCATMWKSISVFGAGTLIVKNNCHIADGREAIKVMGNATVSITDNTFERNLTAISMGLEQASVKLPVNFPNKGGIWGNSISGGNLKTPYAGETSLKGILVNSISNLTIGRLDMPPNTIQNLHNSFGNGYACHGIATDNSTVKVINTQFTNIGIPAFNNSNLYDAAIAAYNGSTLTVEGSANTVQGGVTGVYLHNSGGEILHATVNQAVMGVVHTSDNTGANQNVRVQGCTFSGFQAKGIYVTGSVRLSYFDVKNCIFDDNREIPNSRVMLDVAPSAPKNASGFNFSDNTFFYRNHLTNYASAICVKLYNLYNGAAERNQFFDQGTTPGGSGKNFLGVDMQGCNSFRWVENNFQGADGGVIFKDIERCFHVVNSPLCQYRCNFMDGFAVGMQFYEDCGGSILSTNDFNTHSAWALELAENGTVVGPQNKRMNRWMGSDAFLKFDNFDPSNPSHVAQVQKSLFTIQDENQGTDFWPDFWQVGNIPKYKNWFVYSSTAPFPQLDCADVWEDPDKTLGKAEKAIIDGNFVPWKGYEANTWDAARLLLQRMKSDGALRPSGSPEYHWYAEQEAGHIGKFQQLMDGMVALSTSNAAGDGAQRLLADLNELSVKTTHEQNLKTVMAAILKTYLPGEKTLNDQEIEDLRAIADQCRYEGGVGVVLARLLLGQAAAKPGDCSAEMRNAAAQPVRNLSQIPAAPKMTVFPNPVRESFSIQFDQNVDKGVVRLVDVLGVVKSTWTFSGDRVDIQDGSIPAGVYQLQVLQEGKISAQQPIMLLR